MRLYRYALHMLLLWQWWWWRWWYAYFCPKGRNFRGGNDYRL